MGSADTPVPYPAELRAFVQREQWTYAKTMPEWPHDYLVRDRVDKALFLSMVKHIRTHGFEGRFYEMPITYFAEDGMIYWTMGAPIEATTIINRCKAEDSYENRRRSGTLPEDLKRK
jgi:hypothetical protein